MLKNIRVREFEAVVLPRSTYIIIHEGEGEDEEDILCLESIEEVDDLIHQLIAVRNRAWPMTPLEVQP